MTKHHKNSHAQHLQWIDRKLAKTMQQIERSLADEPDPALREAICQKLSTYAKSYLSDQPPNITSLNALEIFYKDRVTQSTTPNASYTRSHK